MSRRYIKKEDRDEVEFEGIMRLVDGIMLHILDNVAISGKWLLKDIGMKTLLSKKKILGEMRDWMRTWQWDVWLNIYCQHNNYDNHLVKRRFELIRKESTKYVNNRIKNKIEKDKRQNVSQDTI